MRNVFDHLGKMVAFSALRPCGLTVLEDVIAPDARRADIRHEPDPARAVERARLGLLGRIAASLCLIELYSGAPDEDDALACLGKLIAFRQGRQREALKKRKGLEKAGPEPPAEPFVNPLGWIVAARRPTSVLAGLAATQATDWPRGVYFSTGALPGTGAVSQSLDSACGMLRMAIVVASELPRETATLLVRFMAAGPLLQDAMADLAALEEGAHERVVAEQILVDLADVLGTKPSPTPEEEELIVTIQSTWTEARALGRDEGRAEEAARAVLTALRVRRLTVPDAMRERILAEKDRSLLERWYERAILAASIAEVMDDPS